MFVFLDYGQRLVDALDELGSFFFREIPLLNIISTALNAVLPSEFHIAVNNISYGTMIFGVTVVSILLYRLLKFVVGIVSGS